MPKQEINYDREHPDTLAPEFSLHWNGGSGAFAQLGVEFDVEVMREHLALLAKHSPTDKRTSIYSIGLTREELQRLIRSARRARDAVFGSDE